MFRLHAPDGSEFLFGADSEEQQEEWVSHTLKNFFHPKRARWVGGVRYLGQSPKKKRIFFDTFPEPGG